MGRLSKSAKFPLLKEEEEKCGTSSPNDLERDPAELTLKRMLRDMVPLGPVSPP